MKKVIVCFLLSTCFVCLCACRQVETTTNEHVKTYEYEENVITESEAEGKATVALYNWLKAIYGSIDTYDISLTKYSIGSITGSGSTEYTVNGTYSLYDKYGNFEKRLNFSVKVYNTGRAEVVEY